MRLRQILFDVLFGMFFLDLYRETAKAQRQLELLTEFLTLGDIIGVPFLSSYYALRLLPYFVGDLYEFKAELLKERDVLEGAAHIDVH